MHTCLHTKPQCSAKSITRLNYDFGYTDLPAFITAQQRKRNKSPLRWSAIVKLDQWRFWASINQRRCQKYSACSRCATARGSWKIVEDLCSFPYLSAIDLSVIQSWGSCVRKTLTFTQMKKKQWSYSSRRPVNHKIARGSNRGFEHRTWNMLRILPYKWHRRTYIQGHDQSSTRFCASLRGTILRIFQTFKRKQPKNHNVHNMTMAFPSRGIYWVLGLVNY